MYTPLHVIEYFRITIKEIKLKVNILIQIIYSGIVQIRMKNFQMLKKCT